MELANIGAGRHLAFGTSAGGAHVLRLVLGHRARAAGGTNAFLAGGLRALLRLPVKTSP